METIKDAAKEYSGRNEDKSSNTSHNFTKYDLETAFIAGVEFAQKWISINELPPKEEIDFLEDFSIDILLKNEEFVTTGYYDFNDKSFTIYGNGHEKEKFTHWRPIEVK